jgi:hypothetical protein
MRRGSLRALWPSTVTILRIPPLPDVHHHHSPRRALIPRICTTILLTISPHLPEYQTHRSKVFTQKPTIKTFSKLKKIQNYRYSVNIGSTPRGNSIVQARYEKSSLDAKAKLLKAEILCLTEKCNNNNNNNNNNNVL